MNLTDIIFHSNNQRSRRSNNCLVQGDVCYSYAELFEKILSASAFLETNFKKGERVAILSENNIEFVSSYLACLHTGIIAVPVNTSSYGSELEFISKDCQVQAVLASSKFYDGIDGSLKKILLSSIFETKAKPYSTSSTKENDIAALIYTSGSTGKPNAVKITHKNMVANTRSIVQYLKPRFWDKVMVVLPFYYCYGASLMHMTLVTGGCLVLNNRFMFPQKVVDEISQRKCSIFAGVPSTYRILMTKTKLHEADTSSLRYALQAGGRLSPNDLLNLRKAIPKTKIVVMYGQTEATARLSYLPPELFLSKIGSIGKGIPGVELQVVDAYGKQAKTGEIGEIRARGDSISPGYWNRPEETKKTFRDGWLYTGDLAKIDKDGFIYVVGRRKDFIKSGGNRFSAVEIEDLISSFNGVESVAAIGVPDDILGECVQVFVVAKGLKEEDIIKFCSKNLPSYKVPKKVTFIEELPLNAFGKVQKFRLLKRD